MARTLLNDSFDMASLLSSGFCNSTEYLDILHLSGLSVTVNPLPRFSHTIHPVAYGSANPAHSWQLASREDLKNITAILESGDVSIDCPVPVCAFPISSSYASTRRILFYFLMALCLFAPTRTTVRRLSIMGLGMYGFVSSLHFLILSFSNHSVIDYDSIPTATMTLSTLLVVIWNTREIAAFSGTSSSSSDEEEEPPEPACQGGRLGFALFFTFVPLYITVLFLGVIIGGPPEGLSINLLRSNQGGYRITSSCYNHSVDGATWKLWDPNGSFPVRSMKEMFGNPVPYQKGVEGDLDTVRLVNIVQSTLSVLSRKAWWAGITIVGLSIVATLVIARAPACCDSETPDGQVGSIEIPIGEIFEWISERDPRSRLTHLIEKYHLKDCSPRIAAVLLLTLYCVTVLAVLTLTFTLEVGIQRSGIPSTTTPKDPDQWGVVVACVIVLAIAIYFDTTHKQRKAESRARISGEPFRLRDVLCHQDDESVDDRFGTGTSNHVYYSDEEPRLNREGKYDLGERAGLLQVACIASASTSSSASSSSLLPV